MKKCISFLLAAALILSLAACGGNEKPAGTDPVEIPVKGPLDLLSQVWNSYEEDKKFHAAGGDLSEVNMATDRPGSFGVNDVYALDYELGFPEALAEKIDHAASLTDMLDANTFTCGAFHAVDAEDVDELCAAIKDNITQREWVSTSPEKLVIVKLGSYIVSVFGDTEPVDIFIGHLNDVFPDAETVCDEPLS